MTRKGTKEKQARPLVKCPCCDYTCHGKQPLGRHLHYKHPGYQIDRQPRISIKSETLQELLGLIDQKLAAGRLDEVSDSLGKAVRRQDLKLHLTLAAVASSKAERASQLEELLNRVSLQLIARLTEEVLKEMPIPDLVSLQKKLSDGVTSDTEFMKGILTLKGGGDSAFFLRVMELIRVSTKGKDKFVDSKLVRFLEVQGGKGGMDQSGFTRLVHDIIEHDRSEAPRGVLAAAPGSSGEGPDGAPAVSA